MAKKDKTPSIRFAGFNDPWEQRKLGEVVEKEIKGKAKASLLGGRTPYLETNYLNNGEITYVNSNSDVEKNDVIILWDGSMAGKVYFGFEGALGSTLKAYKTTENGQFIYYFMISKQELIYSNYRTPNIPHVVKSFKDEFDIHITSIEEQKKIGELFKRIDDLITLHQRLYFRLKFWFFNFIL